MWWLLEKAHAELFRKFIEANASISAEKIKEFEKSAPVVAELVSVGSTAQIKIEGILTKNVDYYAKYFGGGNTTYRSIIEQVAIAENDPNITAIDFMIDSPGGEVNGIEEAATAIRNATKPTRAVVVGMAASGGYWLASQAGTIIALNKLSAVGSIGVAISFFVSDFIVDITSTNAPNKRPDVSTEEGKAQVQEWLDMIHEIFAGAVADGRGVSVKKVNTDFGRGGMLLAGQAQEVGMIDSISGSSNGAGVENDQNLLEVVDMTLSELKAQHPELVSAIQAESVAAERDRVNAHIIMGEGNGALDVACKAIKDGVGMTETLKATYMMAGVNKQDVDNRSDDEGDADAGDAGTTETKNKDDLETEVHNGVAKLFGGEVE